jgi:hypothetical protein
MAWDATDFLVFAALIASVSLVFVFAIRANSSRAYRLAVSIALAAAFLLLWVNGAISIIGDEGNDANLMYLGVIVVGLIGAVIARFQLRGMARALYVMALAQILVAAIALAAKLGVSGPIWPNDVLALTGFFTALWLASGWLFGRSAQDVKRGGV